MNRWVELVEGLERWAAVRAAGRRQDRAALIAVVLHGVFESAEEARSGAVRPYQPFLIDDLRRLIEHFLGEGYAFVTPHQILNGLKPERRYLWLTFDDGYANNLRAGSVLHEFGVPATFFVAADPVSTGKAFWWDVLYRERQRRGSSEQAITKETTRLTWWTHEAIEAYLVGEFGAAALRPVSETDRPLTEPELRHLAADPLVSIGNHTVNHAVLTGYTDRDAVTQITEAQAFLQTCTGDAPIVIAYPAGACNARVVSAARRAGLRLGVTARPSKNYLPLRDTQQMTIGRYFIKGGRTLLGECLVCQADLQVTHSLRRLRAALL